MNKDKHKKKKDATSKRIDTEKDFMALIFVEVLFVISILPKTKTHIYLS